MNDSLKKGVIRVLIANIISLVFSLLTNFILPKYLSIESYSTIKTFQLYIVYIGVLHLGYEDGMYLKYGGKTIMELEGKDIETNLYTLRIFQTVMTAIMVVVAWLIKDIAFLAFAFAIFPVNLVAYFKLLFQAIGEFGKYGRIMNLTSIVTFIINVILVFVIKTDNYSLFLAAYVIWDILLWISLEIYTQDKLPRNTGGKKFSMTEMKENIRMGLPLTLGNFSSVLMTSIDRWFVKLLMSTIHFAQYSFAVSTESIVNVALAPVVVTLYNYFCKHTNLVEIKKMRNCIMIFATYVVSCAFGAKFIIERFLDKYIDAANVMFILFASQICYVVIKGIYVNIYKAQKRQKDYFTKLMFVVIIGIVLNAVFYFIIHCKEAFAVGTLVLALIWLVLCLKDFPELDFKVTEGVYLLTSIIFFILCGAVFNSIVGFIIYILYITAAALILMRQDLRYLFKVVILSIPNKRVKG